MPTRTRPAPQPHPPRSTAARDVIGRAYAAAGLPAHEAILGMGCAPDLPEASSVSRTLDDAEDLHASSRPVRG